MLQVTVINMKNATITIQTKPVHICLKEDVLSEHNACQDTPKECQYWLGDIRGCTRGALG